MKKSYKKRSRKRSTKKEHAEHEEELKAGEYSKLTKRFIKI